MWYSQSQHKENSWGYHLMVDAARCNENIKEKQKIIEFIHELVPAIDMIAVGEPMIKYFPGEGKNKGYSCCQFIEASNVSCHFIESSQTLYLDVFSCKDFNVSIVMDILKKYFDPKKTKKHFIYRDATKLEN